MAIMAWTQGAIILLTWNPKRFSQLPFKKPLCPPTEESLMKSPTKLKASAAATSIFCGLTRTLICVNYIEKLPYCISIMFYKSVGHFQHAKN